MNNVMYLEHGDISSNGLASYVGQGKPVVLMVQGNFCGYCTQAKPAFQKFAQDVNGKAVAASITIDGGSSDKKAYEEYKNFNKEPGVPAYLGFDKNGQFVKIHSGGRDANALAAFAQSL